MKKKIILLIIACAILLLNGYKVDGQELPYLRDLSVQATVNFNPNTGIYTYSFSINNGHSSNGKIDELEIDISRDSQSISYDTVGLQFAKTWMEGSFQRMYPKLAHRIVPVGFPAVPPSWDGLIGIDGTAAFFTAERDILQGQTLSGFVMSSKGLPGVRRFIAHPYYDPNDYYPSIDDVSVEEAAKIVAQVDSDMENIAFKGKTLGPTAPPADFKPIEFLNYIINMKHEAFTLGWIKNKGIENSLDAKLDNTKKKIEQGNTQAAKGILNAFINEVEAQGCESYDNCTEGKHLTPEAYALLKYNVQYLISNLK